MATAPKENLFNFKNNIQNSNDDVEIREGVVWISQ